MVDSMDCVPFEESTIDDYRSKQDWDASAAELVATMLGRWHLTAAEAMVGGEAGSVFRVTTAAGTSAVLKVGFPHIEGVWEAVALESWAGLAPAVLRQDAWTWSLLLEDVRPGTRLDRAELPAREALLVGAELYRELQRRPVPPDIVRLSTIMGIYLDNATARMPAQRSELTALGVLDLMEAAFADLAVLSSSEHDSMLHGDFNPGNILLDSGGRWRVVDPKPMIGDPAFDPFPLIEQLGDPWRLPAPAENLADALGQIADIIGCDVERAARWCTARSALNVSWFLNDGDRSAAKSAAAELRLWAKVSGL